VAVRVDSAALAVLVAADMAVGIGLQSVGDINADPWAPRIARMAVVGMVVAGIVDVDTDLVDMLVAGTVVDPDSGGVAAVQDNIVVPTLGIGDYGAVCVDVSIRVAGSGVNVLVVADVLTLGAIAGEDVSLSDAVDAVPVAGIPLVQVL
jgi:hypothetical protein